MDMCSVVPLSQLVKESGTQSMPGKSAPFLTKAEYPSSQSPQCPGPAAENVSEKGKQRPWPLRAAGPSASETFPFS